MPFRRNARIFGSLIALGVASYLAQGPPTALQAQSRTVHRSYARASVHNVNVNRNVDVHVHDTHYDRWGHPIARAAAMTATAVAIGTIVASLPPRCSTMVVGGLTYQNCGGVYYQPVYHGTAVQYVVVAKP